MIQISSPIQVTQSKPCQENKLLSDIHDNLLLKVPPIQTGLINIQQMQGYYVVCTAANDTSTKEVYW